MATQLTDDDARALISVFAALLAAFGFFYTGVRDTVRAGVFEDPKTPAKRTERRGLVREGLWPGMTILAVSSCLVAAIMLPPLVEAVGSIDASTTYSPSKTALVVLAVFWLLLASFWTFQAIRAAFRLMRW